jgi:integrase
VASAEKLPSGRWRGVYRDASGKKCHTKAPHYARKRDAKDAANEEEVKARRQAARHTGTLSPRTLWGAWWDTIQPQREQELAGDGPQVEKYRVESVIRPRWGETPLNRIGNVGVQDWVDDLAKKYSASYTHHLYITFKVSMNKAVASGVLTGSPCVNIKLPSIIKKPKAPMEVPEAGLISQHLPKGADDAIELGMETGLRPSELAGLHANRADLEGGWLGVHEVYVRRRKAIKAWPKNEKPRVVALTEKAIEIIKRNLEGRDLNAGCGVPHLDGSECRSVLILLNSRGKVVCPEQLRQRMITACAKAGVSRKSPYATRRGYATRLAEGGLDPFEASRQMGHASLEQTMDYVWQTSRTRGRIVAALGEPVALTVVDGGGQAGTRSGTDLDSQALPETPSEAHENAG